MAPQSAHVARTTQPHDVPTTCRGSARDTRGTVGLSNSVRPRTGMQSTRPIRVKSPADVPVERTRVCVVRVCELVRDVRIALVERAKFRRQVGEHLFMPGKRFTLLRASSQDTRPSPCEQAEHHAATIRKRATSHHVRNLPFLPTCFYTTHRPRSNTFFSMCSPCVARLQPNLVPSRYRHE